MATAKSSTDFDNGAIKCRMTAFCFSFKVEHFSFPRRRGAEVNLIYFFFDVFGFTHTLINDGILVVHCLN